MSSFFSTGHFVRLSHDTIRWQSRPGDRTGRDSREQGRGREGKYNKRLNRNFRFHSYQREERSQEKHKEKAAELKHSTGITKKNEKVYANVAKIRANTSDFSGQGRDENYEGRERQDEHPPNMEKIIIQGEGGRVDEYAKPVIDRVDLPEPEENWDT